VPGQLYYIALQIPHRSTSKPRISRSLRALFLFAYCFALVLLFQQLTSSPRKYI
jgi:H+/Cl- antiporter ClcA